MNNVLCRLCLTKCEECEFGMCITSQDGVLRNLPKMIRECILIDVTDCEPHFFSKFICNECIYRLELFYSFREQSLKNQEYYNGLLLYYQQTMPCTSKAVPASVPLHSTNVFGIESDLQHEPDHPEQQNDELPDINFTMMDESEKHQLSKDYDDIIRSLQKDDLDFTANEEELVIKHELEISIQQSAERKRTETMKEEKQARENCTLSDAHIMQTQSNVCFDPYVDIAQSIVHDPAVPTTPDEDEGLDYDDFAGIETGVSHDNEETITSEIQVESLIGNEVQEENLDMMQQIVSSHGDQLPPVTAADSLGVPSSERDSIDQFSKPPSLVLPTDSNYSPQLFRTEMDSNATPSSSIITGTNASTADVPPTALDDKTCEVCFKTFRSRQKLKIHRNTHLRVAPFKCTFDGCDKAFKSRIGLEEHLARHTNCFEYTCDICSKGFQHRSYLSAHRRAHNTERNFQCTLCEQSFKSKQALLDHKNRHLGLKPFGCAQCDKQYTKSSLLQAHVKQCHNEGGADVVRYPCTECGKTFTSKSYLTVHKKIHRNEREFVCEVCNKGHVTRQDLLIHMTKHTGEKSLVCDICGKAYARRGAMEWHRRTHTKETPYKCDICGQTFTQATPLQVHRKLHDPPGKLEEKGQPLVSGVKVEHGR